jgi:cysteine desulfurase
MTVMEKFVSNPVFDVSQLSLLTQRLVQLVDQLQGSLLVGSRSLRLPNTVSFVVQGTDSIALLAGLDMEGICASSGSACSAGSLEPSHVIRSLGLGDDLANALVRFSLGRETTPDEVALVEKILPTVIRRVQRSQ